MTWIRVTTDDVRAGRRTRGDLQTCCPVARAARRALRRPVRVTYVGRRLAITQARDVERSGVLAWLPAVATRFIRAFDRHLGDGRWPVSARPLSFRVSVR